MRNCPKCGSRMEIAILVWLDRDELQAILVHSGAGATPQDPSSATDDTEWSQRDQDAAQTLWFG